MLDELGRVVPVAYTVRYDVVVPRSTVRLTVAESAAEGTWPASDSVSVAPAPSGAVGAPMPLRVSSTRVGTIEWYTVAGLDVCAAATTSPPPLKLTAIAAPMAAHRLRHSAPLRSLTGIAPRPFFVPIPPWDLSERCSGSGRML